MNAMVKATAPQTLALTEEDAIQVLQNSLYPGARPESIRMVLAWCRATGRDPMKKPIHIVPMKVKDAATGKEEMRDVLMPGIGTYRSDAAETGSYAGLDEPEFGPEIRENVDGTPMRYPAWCKVSVRRIVQGESRMFTAKEYWLENYASGYQGKGVNAMWRRRPWGQLAKCTEAQALRKGFPDETGNSNTMEEMEGKSFAGVTLEGDEEVERSTTGAKSAGKPGTARALPAPPAADPPEYLFAKKEGGFKFSTAEAWLKHWDNLVRNCIAADALDKLQIAYDLNRPMIGAVADFDPEAANKLVVALTMALANPPAEDAPSTDHYDGVAGAYGAVDGGFPAQAELDKLRGGESPNSA